MSKTPRMTDATADATMTATVAARVSRTLGQVTRCSSSATSSETVWVRGIRHTTTAATAATPNPSTDESSHPPMTSKSFTRVYARTSSMTFSRKTPSASAATTYAIATIRFGCSIPPTLSMALPCVRRRDRWLQRSRPTSLLAGQEDSIPGRAFSKSRPLPQRSRPPLHFFWQARRDSNPQPAPFRSRDRCRSGLDQTHFFWQARRDSNPQPAPFRSRDRCRSGLDQTHFFWQARRDSNPQPAVLETAALAVGATGLSCRALLRLLVLHVLAAARAELGERELVLRLLLVLRRRVVPLFAGLALERDDRPV